MILYCKCDGNDLVADDAKEKISNFLENSGLEYAEVADLCDLITNSATLIKKLLADTPLSVVACYSRTIEGLFYSAGVPVKDNGITYYNMREQGVDDIIISLKRNASLEKGARIEVENESRPVAWFPVIDYDRCTHCGQCMDFCLFGVYERMPDKSIKVVKPENCKDNCPACARICPHVAIIFPKLSEKPINGAEVVDIAAGNKNLKLNIKDMLGDDVYTALAARKKRSKKTLLKSQDIEKAETERKACSCKCNAKT
jgi:NAD-dependent dihydropyrimidine dehydrogenase PreA subunit